MFIKVKDCLIELAEEEPKAECGHALMIGICLVLLTASAVIVYALIVG